MVRITDVIECHGEDVEDIIITITTCGRGLVTDGVGKIGCVEAIIGMAKVKL